MPKTFTPPKAAQEAAQKVLDWKDKYGDEVKGMTSVGWARARQLAGGKPISLDTVKRMAQFNRHRQNSEIDPKYKGTPWKDAGRTAWLGWGGDTGIDWAIRISERESKMQKAYLSAINLLPVAKAYLQQPKPMVYKANHTGVMVALFPPDYLTERLAIPDGEAPNELHITLAYLGDMDDVDNLTGLLPVVWNWAKRMQPFSAKVNGIGRFDNDETAFVALLDSSMFPPFRENLMLDLLANGYSPRQEHGFIPHITLKYIEADEPLPLQRIELVYIPFGTVSLVVGGQRFDCKLGDQPIERAMVNKYGARNSRPDLGMLQQVHDLTVKLGAVCRERSTQ